MLVLSVAFGCLFFALAVMNFSPTEAYAHELHIENSAWCKTELAKYAAEEYGIPVEVVRMCKKELGA